MANLLSASDIADIFASFADLADTFFEYPAIFKIRQPKMSAFVEDRGAAYSVTEKSCRILALPEKREQKSEAETANKGFFDNSEMVAYCYWADLLAAGLADQQKVDVVPGRDTIVFAGEEFDVIGVNGVGPLQNNDTDYFVLAKFQTKRRVKNNASG